MCFLDCRLAVVSYDTRSFSFTQVTPVLSPSPKRRRLSITEHRPYPEEVPLFLGGISQNLVGRQGRCDLVATDYVLKSNGVGRVLSCEVMIPNAAIRNLIREDKVHQIYSQMQVGQSKYGMQTMNQSLIDLYQRGLISLKEAQGRTPDPEEFQSMLEESIPTELPIRTSPAVVRSSWCS